MSLVAWHGDLFECMVNCGLKQTLFLSGLSRITHTHRFYFSCLPGLSETLFILV